MQPSWHELFVYYRVPAAHFAALAEQAQRMQAALIQAHPGLEARLLRRADEAADGFTLMETYTLPLGCDLRALRASIAAAAQALAPWIVGERHVEHFVPCAW